MTRRLYDDELAALAAIVQVRIALLAVIEIVHGPLDRIVAVHQHPKAGRNRGADRVEESALPVVGSSQLVVAAELRERPRLDSHRDDEKVVAQRVLVQPGQVRDWWQLACDRHLVRRGREHHHQRHLVAVVDAALRCTSLGSARERRKAPSALRG